MNVAGFGITLKNAQEFIELKKKADAGDKAARVAFFEKAAARSYFTLEEAQKRAKELTDLTDDQKKKIDGILLSLEVRQIASTVTQDEATKIEAGRKFAEMKKAGRVATGDQEIQPFNIFIMDYAYSIKNAALFEESYTVLKEKFGARMNKKFKDMRDKQLAELKESK